MSGHSKWANIQHRKNTQDKKRAKVFTKLIRELTISSRLGGGDSNCNPRLRLAVDKALSQNMPRDTIDRAIKRGAGSLEASNIEEIAYEGYGPSGVAVLVECMTDNRNRTVAEVRHAFTKAGGNLGTTGSVAYMFSKKGQIIFPPESNEEQIMEIAIEAGAEDVQINDDGSIDVITDANELESVKEAISKAGLSFVDAEVTMLTETRIQLDEETSEKMTRLIDTLEDLDDVQEVYSNADFSTDDEM